MRLENCGRPWERRHGSRGKCELPGNLKDFLVNTVRQTFPSVGRREEKMLVDRINEVLQTLLQFEMGLLHWFQTCAGPPFVLTVHLYDQSLVLFLLHLGL